MFVVTLGFYSWYWAYKIHEEMGRHTDPGVGGVLGLVIWILITAVSAFVIPSEVGNMTGRMGESRRSAGGRACGSSPASS